MNSGLARTVPVTNRVMALRRLGGDTKLFDTLAGFFLQDAPALLQKLHDAHRTGAVEIIFQSAHSLKGLAATFDALPFVEIAAEIESLTRAGNLSAIDGLIPSLDHEFSRLVTNLQQSTA